MFMGQDIRAMLIKFAARLDTMKSLYVFPSDMQRTIALKTMEIYAPLADQLGMYRVARDLEDLSFPYLYPHDYQALVERVKERFEKRERYLADIKPLITTELTENGVRVIKVETRAKHYFSLFRKLLRYDMDLERIYDLVAVRVIVENITDCYQALGIIHKNWHPVPGRIKDYIAAPKANGYQSIHTTIRTPGEKNTEIQIRTAAMHEMAELGVAAQFAYAKGKDSTAYLLQKPILVDATELSLTKELRSFPQKIADLDFFQKRIFVLTPKGDVIDLPRGATPVDFAYKIHTDVGDHCCGAKANGKIIPLHSPLQSGDVVEILTQKHRYPSESWLAFVKTIHARDAIRAGLRNIPSAKQYDDLRTILISVTTEDRPGILRELSTIAGRVKAKIQTFDVRPHARMKQFQVARLTCASMSNDKLERLLKKLKTVQGVVKISTERN